MKKNHERILKSYKEIKFEILNYEVLRNAQYLELKSFVTSLHYFINFSVINTELFYYEFHL